MKPLSRRDLLKTGLLAPAAVAAANGMGPLRRCDASRWRPSFPASRERTRRYRQRPARDASVSFSISAGASISVTPTIPPKTSDSAAEAPEIFRRREISFRPSSIAFDDSDWRSVNLPHDWAIELPFENDPSLSSKGFYPLGRTYPATSVGWYRRVFDLPAADAGKRITVEFDGSYRETMVVFNGFYIGTHSGGYDPFQFDLTDFANPGGRNVLLVRVDATLSDGWFYEGAGLYRHVWLVKTHPVHVRQWGTFVRSEIRTGEAALSIRTEVSNNGKTAQNARVISTILDPSGNAVGKAATAPAPISEMGEQTYQQEIAVTRPALWSLEERNLYTLVTEVEANGEVVDRYETPFRHSHDKVRPGAGLLPERQVRQGEGHLQSPGPRRNRRGAARRGAVLPRSQASGDGLQRHPHLA